MVFKKEENQLEMEQNKQLDRKIRLKSLSNVWLCNFKVDSKEVKQKSKQENHEF